MSVINNSNVSLRSVIPTYALANESIKVNNIVQSSINGFLAETDQAIEVTAEIVDGVGDRITGLDQTALGVPGLKLPLLKYLNGMGSKVLDKVYFNVDLTAGVVTVTGKFYQGGDWKLTEDEINGALAAINAPFRITRNPITFLV